MVLLLFLLVVGVWSHFLTGKIRHKHTKMRKKYQKIQFLFLVLTLTHNSLLEKDNIQLCQLC